MCTCGAEALALRARLTREEAERWYPTWDLLELTELVIDGYASTTAFVNTGLSDVYCAFCGRTRSEQPVGGGTVLDSDEVGDFVYVTMSDVVAPSCISAIFVGPEGRYAADFSVLLFSEASVMTPELPPAEAVVATALYRVDKPVAPAAGLYQLIFVDRCLGVVQQVREVALANPLLTLHTRSGHVVAEVGDYSASEIECDTGFLDERLDTLAIDILTRVALAGDLGGTTDDPRVLAIRGHAVADVEPVDEQQLVWSAENNRWES